MDFLSSWHWPVPPNNGNHLFSCERTPVAGNCVISRLVSLVAREKLHLNLVTLISSFNVIHTLKSKHKNQLFVEIAREMGTRSVKSMLAHLLFYPEKSWPYCCLIDFYYLSVQLILNAFIFPFHSHRAGPGKQDFLAIWENILQEVKRLLTELQTVLPFHCVNAMLSHLLFYSEKSSPSSTVCTYCSFHFHFHSESARPFGNLWKNICERGRGYGLGRLRAGIASQIYLR